MKFRLDFHDENNILREDCKKEIKIITKYIGNNLINIKENSILFETKVIKNNIEIMNSKCHFLEVAIETHEEFYNKYLYDN